MLDAYYSSIFLKQSAKDEAAAVIRQLQETESEAKALHSATQRMLLTQEEMVCISSFDL